MTSTEIAAASKIIYNSLEATKMYIGSSLIWEKQTTVNPIPAGYTELAYVTSTNDGQYVDLGCNLCENVGDTVRIWMKFQAYLCSHQSNTCQNILCNIQELGNDIGSGFAFRTHPSTQSVRFTTANGNGNAVTGYDSWQKYDMYDRDYPYETPSSGFYVGTVQTACNKNATLFAAEDANGNPCWFSRTEFYYLKIEKNGTIIRDLVPVKNSQGQVGFYDRIGQTFYTTPTGVAPLVAGPVKLNVSGYTQLRYIASSDQGQYINLNILLYDVLNKNYDIATKFNLGSQGMGGDSQATFFGCQNNSSPWPGTFIRRQNNSVIGRYIGGTSKDNIINDLASDTFTVNNTTFLYEKTSPNKNVTGLNNSGQTHTFGTSLFCAFSNTSNAPYRYAQARLFYFKLFVEGTLVRDMIPAKNSNDVVGLYDVANGVFYTSPNGAAFVAGPEI